MAKNTCVWFKNKVTGAVDGVDRGSEAHRRMKTEHIDDADGVPFLIWEEIDAPKTVKSVPFKSGMQATVFAAPKTGDDEDVEDDDDPAVNPS